MPIDDQRVTLMRSLLAAQGYDAVIVRSGRGVLLFSGYAPLYGDSYCYFPQSGPITLIVPEAEKDLAATGWADTILTFADAPDAERQPAAALTLNTFREMLGGANRQTKYGFEWGPARYAAQGAAAAVPDRFMMEYLAAAGYEAAWHDCTDLIGAGALWRSNREIEKVRAAASVADAGLQSALSSVIAGATEGQIAGAALAAMAGVGGRVLPFAQVLSGPRTVDASKPVFLTGDRTIDDGDTVIVRVQVSVDGYWAAAGRTLAGGDLLDRCTAAQNAGFATISNGVWAGEIDTAIRNVLGDATGPASTGHGVGFDVDDLARPVIAPKSIDVIRPPMSFSLRASAATGEGGALVEDTVLFTNRGAERLTTA